MTTPVSNVVRAPGLGIIAPPPRAVMADAIKSGEKLEIRAGEPIYVFIASRSGVATSVQGLNKRTPFSVTACPRPAGVASPRTKGRWYRIDLRPTAKVGQVDRVALVTARAAVDPRFAHPIASRPFALVVGATRYY